MRRRRAPIEIFSISFLDCICCGLGAVLIVLLLYVHIMRGQQSSVPALRAQISALTKDLQQARDKRTIMGISISHTRLLFLIDCSLSMQQDQRLADVKGAFKIMLASLNDSYHINLAGYTTRSGQNRTPVFVPLWNKLQPVTSAARLEAMQFVTDLEAVGGTPTTYAMQRALHDYPDAEAIVLLSDGEPTDRSAWQDCAADINTANQRRIPIYTIGVGSLMADASSDGRRFMERVARDAGGTCISF
jgi:Mg-chelatase subunit ChlD